MDPVNRVVPLAFLGAANELSTETSSCGAWSIRLRILNRRVGRGPLHEAAFLHPVEEPPSTVDIVVLEVDKSHRRIGQRQVVALHVTVDEVMLRHPVALRGQLQRIPGNRLKAVLPHREDLRLLSAHVTVIRISERSLQKLCLHVECRQLATV